MITSEMAATVAERQVSKAMNIKKELSRMCCLPVVVLADADAQPGAMMVVSFHAVIAGLAVDGANGSIDVAFHTVFLMSHQSTPHH
jgi:hypothetical protein